MMSKEKIFIANILLSVCSKGDERMLSVVTWPIEHLLEGAYCVRVVVTRYDSRNEKYVRLLDMPMSGLQLHWSVQCLYHVGMSYLAGEFQKRFDKHFEMEHTRVIIKKSVKEWQSL